MLTVATMETPAGRAQEILGMVVWVLCLAPAILLVAAWSSPVAAHHPGGAFEPLMLIDGRQDGFRAVLEVYPPEPLAGSNTQFMLWVTSERWGSEYRGAARIWFQNQSAASAPPVVVPMPEEGRGAGVYLAEHRFDRDGTYRVEVELVGLPTRWTGSLRVDPASRWILSLAKLAAFGALVAAFTFFLWWQEARRGRVP